MAASTSRTGLADPFICKWRLEKQPSLELKIEWHSIFWYRFSLINVVDNSVRSSFVKFSQLTGTIFEHCIGKLENTKQGVEGKIFSNRAMSMAAVVQVDTNTLSVKVVKWSPWHRNVLKTKFVDGSDPERGFLLRRREIPKEEGMDLSCEEGITRLSSAGEFEEVIKVWPVLGDDSKFYDVRLIRSNLNGEDQLILKVYSKVIHTKITIDQLGANPIAERQVSVAEKIMLYQRKVVALVERTVGGNERGVYLLEEGEPLPEIKGKKNYTFSNQPTTEAKGSSSPRNLTFWQEGKEYYQSSFTLEELNDIARHMSKGLGYWHGEGVIQPSADGESLVGAIYLVKREDYAQKAYEDLVQRWGGDLKNKKMKDYLIPLKWYHLGGDYPSMITEKERKWEKRLKQRIRYWYENGLPRDPAIKKIFMPTPEERRDLYGQSPEVIAHADAIYFVYKSVQKNEEGEVMPPEETPPHWVVPFRGTVIAMKNRAVSPIERSLAPSPSSLEATDDPVRVVTALVDPLPRIMQPGRWEKLCVFWRRVWNRILKFLNLY